MDHECICVDRPQLPSGSSGAGRALRVAFTLAQGRCQFESYVLAATRIVRVNATRRVVGMALAIPATVEVQQRRREYRLGVAGQYLVPVHCHEADALHDDRAPCNARRFDGRLVNVSIGGMGIAVVMRGAPTLSCHARFWCEFALPPEPQPFQVLAQVRHHRNILDGTTMLIGLRFLDWPDPVVGRVERRIVPFIADEQRRQLRRRK
jgi:c-di-GMP-binding flagellar brake protein YcgR